MPTATSQVKEIKNALNVAGGPPNRKPSKHHSHRYGRVRREGDEEIIREAQSDYGPSDADETDDDDSFSESSVVSAPESGLQSSGPSQPTPEQTNVHVSIVSLPSEPGPSSGARLLDALREPRLDWSDSVFTSQGDVPVLQFDQMGDIDAIDEEKDENTKDKRPNKPHHPSAQSVRRPVGMTARQVYLKRLENDPAYTPRVGEFWGHDERLLDKDLRSLSGWWRGKWTGRGGFHDRGRDFGHRGRGNAGNFRTRGGSPSHGSVDPVDQAWKHDGFEEMKMAEETTKDKVTTEESQRAGSWVGTRGRGRGGFGRGFGHPGRMNRAQSIASQSQPLSPASTRPQGRVRIQSTFWNRSEQPWTKHATNFLFYDTLGKPKEHGDIGVKVKLPGQHRHNIVRIVSKVKGEADNSSDPTPSRNFIVKLPKPNVAKEDQEKTVRSTIRDSVPEGTASEASNVVSNATVPPTPPPSNDPSMEATATTPVAETQSQEPTPKSTEEQPQPKATPVDSQASIPPNIQLITHLPVATPSPAYSSPSYGPGHQYPLPRPAPVYPPSNMPLNESSVWYDPRMPYGYPTPPPVPNMYTPPPPVHHAHHHSHSISHSGMVRQPGGAPPYFGQPVQEYQQGQPMVEYPQTLQPQRGTPPVFTYGADGAMIDVQTGTPIFSLPKTAKIAIKKPVEGDGTRLQHPKSNSTPSLAPGTTSNVPAQLKEHVQTGDTNKQPLVSAESQQGYSARNPGDMQTPIQGYAQPPGQSAPFWGGYAQGQQGYYYPPQQYAMTPHLQDYSYGAPMQAPPGIPVPGYVQPPYGEGTEYQPPVYY